MLRKVVDTEVEGYIDFAYDIVLNQSQSSYPIFTDKIKTKEDFRKHCIKSTTKENYESLLYYDNGNVKGLIQYYSQPTDRYWQLIGFNVLDSTEQALDELLEYLRLRFQGYTLYFGFPEENTQALRYLENHGFECVEKAYNDSYLFEGKSEFRMNKNVLRVTRENFYLFETLHHPDEATYWNSERIYNTLDAWNIFVLLDGEICVGTIYERDDEIYGIDYAGGCFDEDTYSELVKAVLNNMQKRGSKFLTFFNEENSQESAIKLGFELVGKYVLYIKTLDEWADS